MSTDSNITQLTDELFENEVLHTPGVVFLDFYADWCGPCKAMEPAIKEAAKQNEGKIRFYKIDADDADKCGNLLTQYGIRSIPTMFVLNIKEMRKHDDGSTADVDVDVIEKMVGALDGLTFISKLENAYHKATDIKN